MGEYKRKTKKTEIDRGLQKCREGCTDMLIARGV